MTRTWISAVAAAGLAILTLFAAPTTVAAQDVKVIVNSANSTTELPGDVVTKLFLKQTTKFPNGTAAQPVDQAKGSSARAAFSKSVLGRGVAAVESYWQQQIFSGRGTPPRIMNGDAAVIAFVTANPGAIGYVSGQADVSAVRTVTIEH